MKLNAVTLAGLCLMIPLAALAQTAVPDPVMENLFPPELIKQNQAVLNLSEIQKNALREEQEKSQDRVMALQERLQKEKQNLALLVKKDRVNESDALAAAEKALNLDRDIKREQLALLIRIKNRLTPDQQNTLLEIKTKGQVLQEKLRKTQELAKQRTAEGKDLSELQALRDQFEAFLREGKLKEAETSLDKAIRVLETK